MRLILGITMLMLGAGSLLCRLDGLAVDLPTPEQQTDWVRTASGWEHRGEWFSSEVAPVNLHPLVVATGEAMLSVLALVYFAEDASKRRAEHSDSA